MRQNLVIGALVLLVAGCSGDDPLVPPKTAAQGPQPAAEAQGTARLELSADVIDGEYQTQTLLNRWQRGNIDHVTLKLFVVSGSTEAPVMAAGAPVFKTVSLASLTQPVAIGNLFAGQTYRVRAYAFKASGDSLDNQISADEQSYVDIEVKTDDRPTTGTFKVRLKDTVFNGQATSSAGIAVTEGEFVSSGTELFR